MKKILFSFSLILLFSISTPPYLYALPPYVHAQLISVEKRDYKISVDKNTGTIYQFFNKRADPNTNTVHEHYGAAIQIAVHSGWWKSLTNQPCGTQGYWNPTQSGASCSYPDDGRGHRTPRPGTDFHLFCDGILNDNCSNFTNQILQTSFRMMNWDYGSGYEGPYNPADLLFLEQELNLKDNYAQFDLSVINKGIDRGSAFEMPTYYFIEPYRKYYYLKGNAIQEAILPPNTPETKLPITGNFMTVENPNRPNSSITIAWFYSNQFKSDIYEPFVSIHSAPFEGIDYVKFTNAPRVMLRTNKEYLLRYLIIPYKYNEEIETEYGRISVLELINRKADLPRRIGVTLSGTQYGLADQYISPGYAAGNFLTDTNNRLLIGLKSGQNYSNNQALGYAYLAGQHLPPGKKIRKVEFEYETNFDKEYFFAGVDIPGTQFYWKEERFGGNTGKISLSFPPVDWITFGLYSKQNFTYPYPDWEWHFLIKNLKLYYDEPTPSFTIHLVSGWNQITWPDVSGKKASDTPIECPIAVAKENFWFKPYIKNFGGVNFNFESGKTYYLKCNQAVTWQL